jgi:hypothetical protein
MSGSIKFADWPEFRASVAGDRDLDGFLDWWEAHSKRFVTDSRGGVVHTIAPADDAEALLAAAAARAVWKRRSLELQHLRHQLGIAQARAEHE